MKYVFIEARNTVLTPDTEAFLKALESKASNQFVKNYIRRNYRQYLINDFDDPHLVKQIKRVSSLQPEWLQKALKEGKEVFEVNIPPFKASEFTSIMDFLNSLPHRAISIPVKELVQRANAYKDQQTSEEDGIELLIVYPDGMAWVRIIGKKALEREGNIMNHCVGQYTTAVQQGKTFIYSLRDKNNRPHVTVEVKDKAIKQIKGNSNQPPNQKYMPYVEDFLNKNYVKYRTIHHTDLNTCGLDYKESSKKLYRYLDIRNYIMEHELNLYAIEKDIKLPTGLTIHGDLQITESEITSLPENLTVLGDLYADESALKSLPASISVKGGISISNTKVQDISFLKHVHGDLDCRDCTSLWQLPGSELIVDGNLDLSNCKEVAYLPDRLEVGTETKHSCSLDGTRLDEVSNIVCSGTLYLNDDCHYHSTTANRIVGGVDIEEYENLGDYGNDYEEDDDEE